MSQETLHVLLIEDNPGDVRLVREYLREVEDTFSVEEASTLDKGLDRLERGAFDVVLLDLGLPDSQGLESLDRLLERKLPVPVVVLTGLSDLEQGMEAIHRGAQDYLVKDRLEGELLVRTLRYAVERWRDLEALAQRTVELERNETRLQQYAQELEAVLRIAHILAAPQEGFQENLRRLLGVLVEATDVELAALRLPEEEGLRLAAVAGPLVEVIHFAPLLPYGAGVAGRAYARNEPVVVNEYGRFDVPDMFLRGQGIGSVASFPASANGRPHGLVSLVTRATGHFTAQRQALIQGIAAHLGSLLQGARLSEVLTSQLERERHQLDTFRDTAAQLVVEADPHQALQHLVDAARELVDARAGIMVLYREEGAVEDWVVSGVPENVADRLGPLLPDESVVQEVTWGRVVREAGHPRYRFLEAISGEMPLEGCLGIPVPLKRGRKGMLFLAGKAAGNGFSELDERLGGLFSVMAGAFLENADLYRIKTEFISMASHELRTPMTALLGFSELLLSRDPGEEPRRRWLEVINAESRRLADIVSDTLDVSRIQAARLELRSERVEVGSVVERVRGMLAPTSHGHELVERIGGEVPAVWADPERLYQVLLNLVDNAIKYSPEGTRVAISAWQEPHRDRVVVAVHDQGFGIAPGDVERIFTSFQRVRGPETEGIRGTGLGLYITRALVELMGGEIWVDSKPREGSTFSFTLPTVSG